MLATLAAMTSHDIAIAICEYSQTAALLLVAVGTEYLQQQLARLS